MIPIQLTFSGLYSYQEKQQIDFTRLTEGQIFGIFGAVGSGKSSILEAISFALYGETERLNKRDNRYYNMMNLKSSELFIQFEFQAGEGFQERYMIEVKGRRNRKQYQKVSSFERRQFQKDGDKWRPIETPIAEIIGLSYDNFRRTIIIPQGKFQEFLQLGDAERTRMMKEIFNLERFELFHKANQLGAENKEKLSELNGQLAGLNDITAEAIQQKQAEAKKLADEKTKLQQALTEKLAAEKALNQLKALSEKIEKEAKAFADLEAQKTSYQEKMESLATYEHCQRTFSADLEKRRDLKNRIATESKALAEKQQLQSDLQQNEKSKKAAFEKIKATYQHRDKLKQEANDLSLLARIRQSAVAAATLESRMEKGEKITADVENQIKTLQKTQADLESALKEKRQKLAEGDDFIRIQEWYGNNASLEAQKANLEAEKAALATALAEIENSEKKILKEIAQRLPEAVHEDIAFEAILATAKTWLAAAGKKTDKAIRTMEVQAELSSAAHSLTAGEPCPLCGATEHPHILKPADVQEKLAALQAEKDLQQQQLKMAHKSENQLTALAARKSDQEKNLHSLEEKSVQIEKALSEHRKTFAWPRFSATDKSAFLAAQEALQNDRKALSELEKQREEAVTALQKALENREKCRETFLQIEREYRENMATQKALSAELKTIKASEKPAETPASLEAKAAQKLAAYQQVEKDYATAEKEMLALQNQLNVITGEIKSLIAFLESNRQLLTKVEATLASQLSETDYQSLSEIETILAEKRDVEAERKAIAAFQEKLSLAEKLLADSRKEIGEREYDATAHQGLQSEIESLEKRNAEMIHTEGALASEIKKMTADFKTKKGLLKNVDTLEKRRENIGILKTMFKGSGFVNYISSIYLQELCHAANLRFHHLTRRQLQLEIADNNEFQVRDFLNDGQVRSVKTLSGGQTFQASLSLALALADHIQQLSGAAQNFFFLDEGFGTLDKSALQIVFDTLKALRKENRIVGVISHVEELQQEIDVYLTIENDESRGSAIKPSWE